MNDRNQKPNRKILPVLLAFCLLFCACAKAGDDLVAEESDGKEQETQYVYVPEYVELFGAEAANVADSRIIGDFLYYTKTEADSSAVKRFLCEYSLTEQRETRKMLLSAEAGFTYDIRVAEDGRVYVSDSVLSEPYGRILVFDGQGELQMQVDLSAFGARLSQMFAVDCQNRMYIVLQNNTIALMNADGTLSGEIALKDSHVDSIGVGKDGRVYVSYQSGRLLADGTSLASVDFESGKLDDRIYQNVPVSMQYNLIAGSDCDFLLNDGGSLYGYQLAAESAEKLLDWADCGISVNPMGAFFCDEDGTIKVFTRSGLGRASAEMAVLAKTDASALPEKTELVLGALDAGGDLQAAAAAFNRQSDTCHITIRNYTDGGEVYLSDEEALQNLNLDIISEENCPDLLALWNLNAEALAGNGVFEDLDPYLAQSPVLDKEDFLENVLANYTFDGILTAIPATVRLSTLIGRTDFVGEEIGWTFEEMAEIIDQNPDMQPESFPNNQSILRTCLKFGYRDFIDWTSGRADFDCDKFKKMLLFAGRYPSPDSVTYDYSTVDSEKMREGGLLLSLVSVSAYQDIQLYDEQYGGVTFIGYPTADGSNGCELVTFNACAIASKSKHKEEAWKFIEFLANAEDGEWQKDGFPCRKEALRQRMTAVEYLRDSNGDILSDTSGRSLPKYGTVIYNGKEYEYHAVTEDEAALVISLLETAQFDTSKDAAISRIIFEEAEAFFQNRKSADAVAVIIQNRVQLYLDENW
ncbi:MAG: extracellular solute-binding protein [Muribaculum sp.]|nr:extracellular solute-binding protein [Muribaculum sp.]